MKTWFGFSIWSNIIVCGWQNGFCILSTILSFFHMHLVCRETWDLFLPHNTGWIQLLLHSSWFVLQKQHDGKYVGSCKNTTASWDQNVFIFTYILYKIKQICVLDFFFLPIVSFLRISEVIIMLLILLFHYFQNMLSKVEIT